MGIALLLESHAATPNISLEPETGTLGSGAKNVSDASASGGSAVAFGTTVSAPTGLRAVTGGPSIALIWDPIPGAAAGTNYAVYRDGTQIATTTPASANAPVVYQKGARYIDTSITPGTTYRYQVQAIGSGNDSPLTSAISVTAPTNTTPVPTITTDTSYAPDMAGWLNNTVVPEVKIWYPKVSDMIAYPSYTPRSSFKIYLKSSADVSGNRGIAHFDTGDIYLNADYFRSRPSDVGVVVHEATHDIQGYVTGYWPYWIQEGMADWAEFYVYQDFDNPQPNGPYDAYTAGYHPAAYFLQQLQQNSGTSFMRNLNVTTRGGNYTPSFITAQTGKSPDAWWTTMTGHAIATGAIRSASYNNVCADDSNSSKSNGNKVSSNTCDGGDAQLWSRLPQTDGSTVLEVFGLCLDDTNSGTADGTPVQIWGCNGSNAQRWKINSNKTITNVISGKCLYNGGGATSGTQLTLKTCNSSDPGQLWNTP